MTLSNRRLRSAIRLTPKDERARYAEEWEHDLSHAGAAGAGSPQVLRGAMSVALRRRARWTGHALLGGRGLGVAVSGWVVVAVLIVLAFLGGGLFGVALLVGLVLAAVGLTFAGRPSLLTHWLLGLSTVVGICAASYVWWVLGVQIDAADTSTPPSGAATHGGAGLLVLGVSLIVFVASAVAAYTRRPH
ncbi:hypothetical protein [Lapillicoccus sp.]|uniref:hypothetical protein n=1 Tax=Lapillicoccus sp. TaxID=1909287 RepID=UPI003264DD41